MKVIRVVILKTSSWVRYNVRRSLERLSFCLYMRVKSRQNPLLEALNFVVIFREEIRLIISVLHTPKIISNLF